MGRGCSAGLMKLRRGVKGSVSARQGGAGEKAIEINSGVSLLNTRFSLLNADAFDSLELRSSLNGLQKSRVVWLGGWMISGCHVCYRMDLRGLNRMGSVSRGDCW